MWPKLTAKVPFAAVVACCLFNATRVVADTSPAPILQWFEASFETMIDRTPDLFMSGYGSVTATRPRRR
ncbi:MAG: hypothetical protein A2V70_08250 [Planctomycetes bacterium RBG_13_63_9]|nr:MAG: hypothetical protein A2V70_08250 [Planctomycetes bacterium RBG_13_63_9]